MHPSGFISNIQQNLLGSFGQRAMRVAIVHDDASLLTEQHWNKRAILKLRYIIPVLGIFIGFVDLFYAHFTKEENVIGQI